MRYFTSYLLCATVRNIRDFQVVQWQRICQPMQAKQENLVRSWVGEDPLEEEMATHPNVLASKIPWTERSLVGYTSV